MRADRMALVTALALALAPALTARAGHHQWDFTEVFSNASGSIQFVELIGTANNEQNLNGFTITASSGPNVFTFVGNLPSTATAGKWVLVGTSAFALASGAPTPDYVLPDNFFDPTSDSLNYAGVDTWAISNVPVDGVNSLDRATGVGANSPTNFAGQSGSIDVSGGPQVPSFGGVALVVLTGLLLLAGAGISRRRPAVAGA
jgi:hypothetical protein